MALTDLLHSTSTSIAAKLAALRSQLQVHELDGYLIPSADEHLNEYLPVAKQRRIWASGFTGSAGDLLVGRERAWLFVDSRYHEQAELQVETKHIQVCKLGLDGQKTLDETLQALGKEFSQQGNRFRLGFDPFTLSAYRFRLFQKQVEPCGIVLTAIEQNLVDQVRAQTPWVEQEIVPPLAESSVFSLPKTLTGASVAEKLQRLREDLQTFNVQIFPLTKLDQIAWLYNLRGQDIPYNPVFIAYALVTPDEAFLFTNLQRIEPSVRQSLQPEVTLLPYEHYPEMLRSQLLKFASCRVLLDPKHTTMGTYRLVTGGAAGTRSHILETSNPIEGMKARKNVVEIAQMQQANLKASRAKTRTLKWLADRLADGMTVSEQDVAATIEGFYAEEAEFQGLSFNTIAATGANSSIVHYGTPSTKIVLTPGEFFLLDSGSQYAGGTTDDTRTLIVGEPTAEHIQSYTEVLKAHINCAMQRFPKGTTGAQLDGIARSTLWSAGLDYGHGTGHGVGAFLNVHEGPNGISKGAQEPLEPGMVTSVEPGFYKPGWGGVRIENLYVVRELGTDDTQKTWYGFEPLTYIPFDPQLIDLNQLTPPQQNWLAQYNQAIVEKLSPTLSQEEATWLAHVCCPMA